MTTFFQRLEARARQINSLLCIGLDPHGARSAAEARESCIQLVQATSAVALAFKPNIAFFEVFGADGWQALQAVLASIPKDIPVILDAKRGDIASTATAYAKSVFGTLGVDAVTLSPYLGYDAVEPFLQYPDKGVFVLCKTSNAGADEFQNLTVQGGHLLYEQVAARVQTWGDQAGLVVGATDPAALHSVRRAAPQTWFLVPGVGAQGGDLTAALQAGLRPDGLGLLITVSRSIANAVDPRAEAQAVRAAINAARQQVRTPPEMGSTHAQSTPLSALATALAEAGCVRFGKFKLKSGLESPIYIDLRRLVSFPRALRVVAEAVNQVVQTLHFDHMAAIPYAALPIATAAALLSERSLIYPRREAKEYGTKATIEGVYQAGDTAVLIDDLATTGDSKFEAINKLTDGELIVRDIVVLIDREQGAAATLQAAGYRFHAVATLSQLLDSWQAQGILTAAQRAEVDAFLAG